jgi:hypothetical protein
MLARGPVYLWSEIYLTDITPGPFRHHILGSTPSPDWLTASITHHYLNLIPILERTEVNSYLCCPTAILRIILATSQLSVSILGTADAADRAAATASAVDLLYQALEYDIRVWTCHVQSVSPSADLQSREQLSTVAITKIESPQEKLRSSPFVRRCSKMLPIWYVFIHAAWII